MCRTYFEDKSKERLYYCPKCKEELKVKEKERIAFQGKTSFSTIIKDKSHSGKNMSTGMARQMFSRCVGADGESLSGEKGLSFMKKHSDQYGSRLKEYYDVKR